MLGDVVMGIWSLEKKELHLGKGTPDLILNKK